MFQFDFPYHIRTDNIITVLNVLESVFRNIDRNVYRVIFHVATCHVNNLWDNIRFREFVYHVFPQEVNEIIDLYSVSTYMRLNNEYEIQEMDIS